MTGCLDAALAAHRAGLCVVPAARDGSKRPYDRWKQYQQRRAEIAELEHWFGGGDPSPGIGIVCGAVSGGLEMLELEGAAVHLGIYHQLIKRAIDIGLAPLVDRIRSGYEELTPSGGIHWLYRCTSTSGNLKLARQPGHNPNTVQVLIETRGEGGFTIVAPSAGSTHPTGLSWVLNRGCFATIATITQEERSNLHQLCASFDKMPIRVVTHATPTQSGNGSRPGDQYNAATTWYDVLTPHGWTAIYTHGEETAWRRPDKTTGISATTNHLGTDRLKVFSSSTPFDTETTYDRFGAYAILKHAGDLSAAARTLAFFQPRPLRSIPNMPTEPFPNDDPPPADDEDEDDDPFIDWTTFWTRDRTEHEWLIDRIFARGRGHAIYAQKKVGKSLVALFFATELAIHDQTALVIYLDFEMTQDDLEDRLDDMGYGPETDLSRLRYWLLPSLPPLDTEEGGQALTVRLDKEQAHHPECHILIIVDTTSRAVQGPENDADTFRAFYRHTGLKLKQRGHTWARIDHAGHDPSRQRGSSAKGDDVDIVWRLEKADNGYTLRRDAARMGWVPERTAIDQQAAPLKFTLGLDSWPAGTAELADTLLGLNVPAAATVKQARAALKAAGRTASSNVLAAAVKYRKGRGTPDGTPFSTGLERAMERRGEMARNKGGTPDGTERNGVGEKTERPPPLKRGDVRGTSAESEPTTPEIF